MLPPMRPRPIIPSFIRSSLSRRGGRAPAATRSRPRPARGSAARSRTAAGDRQLVAGVVDDLDEEAGVRAALVQLPGRVQVARAEAVRDDAAGLARAVDERLAARRRAPGRRTPGCRRSRRSRARASSSSSEPSGSSSTSPAASTAFVLSFAACTSGWSNGLMPRIEPRPRARTPSGRTPGRARTGSEPHLLRLHGRARRRSPGAGTRPLPSLPVDSASSCSTQRPNAVRCRRARPCRGRLASRRRARARARGRGCPRRAARLAHLQRALEQPAHVDAHQRGRHEPERRQRRVAPADRRLAGEDARKPRSRASCSSAEPGSVIATNCSPAPRASRSSRVCERVSSVVARLRGRDEERALEIELRLERADRLRVRRVEDVEALGAERAAQHLRRERRAAHAEQRRRRRSRRRDVVGEREQQVDAPRACAAARRASRATAPRRRPVQTRRVARPDPLDDARVATVTRRRGLAALGADALEQLVERVDELLHALALERVGRRRRSRRRPRASSSSTRSGLVEALLERVARTSPWSWNASIVSAGIVFTVSGPISSSTYITSRYVRVLRRRRRPEAALRRRALRRERAPSASPEKTSL